MQILIHCDVAPGDISQRLGTPEYSYHFVLESFRDALRQFAQVQQVTDPVADADVIWQACSDAGEACFLLSFTPPHKTPLGLRCPTIPVFAWEYPNLPEGWEEDLWRDDPRHDWRMVLEHTRAALTLSRHTVTAVRSTVGQNYPIQAIPTPVWERFSNSGLGPRHSLWEPERSLQMHTILVDSDRLGLSTDHLIVLEEDETPSIPELDIQLPVFAPYHADSWAEGTALSRSRQPIIDDEQVGWGAPPISAGWDLPPRFDVGVKLSGVVYTAVLTPSDGRKNWEEIITAFGWAFKDVPDATLILKLGGPNQLKHHHQLLMLLTKLSPLKCRVIALHGYLSDSEYRQLIAASTFYVNASLCEGLCMPLLEFLCSGVPALAPAHTSMADYIRSEYAFVVNSIEGEPALWPHGDHQVNRTIRHQIDWHSLMLAYRKSYLVAKSNMELYAAMSKSANSHMHEYCSVETVSRQLHDFLSAAPWAIAAAEQISAADL